jgi:hypothetical protein
MSLAISALVKLLEDLPTSVQDNIVQHVHSYLEDLEQEQRWNSTFLKMELVLGIKPIETSIQGS